MGTVLPLNPEVIRGDTSQNVRTTGLSPLIPMYLQGVIMVHLKVILVSALLLVSVVSFVSAAGPFGQGPGYGNGLGFNLTIPEPIDYNLTNTEVEDLLFMREEEQMAHDLYALWADMYALPIFGNIAQAEETHASEVQFLLDRYQIQTDTIGNLSAGFGNPTIQNLSASLADQGNKSLTDALTAGVIIEKQDISDLDKALANTTREDLKVVYGNLRSGSENHLSAFNQQLS